MKLSLTLTDTRTVHGSHYASTAKTEDFERVTVTDLTGSGQVVAAALRGIADEIDLRPVNDEAAWKYGGPS